MIMDLKDRGLCTLRVLVLVLEDPCFKFLLFTPTGLIEQSCSCTSFSGLGTLDDYKGTY